METFYSMSQLAFVCFADNCHPCMCMCVLLLSEVAQEERGNVNVLRKAVREYGQESVQRCITM